jgi:hypothetical protein
VRGYLRIEEATPHQTLRDWRLVASKIRCK